MSCLNRPEQFVAIDWSGSATESGQRRHIVLAWWNDGDVVLESGFTRLEVGERLMAAAARNPSLVVGFDFAFSFPAWWVRSQGCTDAVSVWSRAAEQGEQWLSAGQAPFWGRPGQARPPGYGSPEWLGFRNTDRSQAVRAKSPFQIGGAGAVGTGSVRGMGVLAALHRHGFHIWPFQAPALPLVVEIYPRLFTGAVVKSDPAARMRHLQQSSFASIGRAVAAAAAASEDAFDALCSVLGMVEHAAQLTTLAMAENEDERLEGAIWQPC